MDILEGGLFDVVFFAGDGELGPFFEEFCGLFVCE